MALPRVASLLPSATEMLCAIGGEHLLVGRSHEDNFPSSIADRPVLTATRLPENLGSAEIDAAVSKAVRDGHELYAILGNELQRLKPTVILTQDLCNVCSVSPRDVSAVISDLEETPLVMSFNPFSLDDVLEDMLRLGNAVGLGGSAKKAVALLRARISRVKEALSSTPAADVGCPKVAFVEWADPVFVGGHWTPELVELAGGRHVLNSPGRKSFRVAREEVEAADPDAVVLCPCGLTLEQALAEASSDNCAWLRKLRAVREGRAVVVDGDAMFNRPGPRLVDALVWLAAWLRPEIARKGLPPLPDNFPSAKWPAAAQAPKRIRDIEDFAAVHEAAVQRGELSYNDPATGYSVFTELYMLRRGYCCGSGCRHCPYGHFNLTSRARSNIIRAPRLLGAGGRAGRGAGVLIAWVGRRTPALAGATVCVVFGPDYASVAGDGTPVRQVMDWALERGVELLVVPEGELKQALSLVRPSEWRIEERVWSGAEEWLHAVSLRTERRPQEAA